MTRINQYTGCRIKHHFAPPIESIIAPSLAVRNEREHLTTSVIISDNNLYNGYHHASPPDRMCTQFL
jgi:hypothetical protein